jgi:hypothetical protein
MMGWKPEDVPMAVRLSVTGVLAVATVAGAIVPRKTSTKVLAAGTGAALTAAYAWWAFGSPRDDGD